MKNFLFTLISLIFLTSINNLHAKTQGNYLEVNFITSNVNFQNIKYFPTKISKNRHTNSSSTYSFGVNYSYAFNYNNFFIAPGLIFEKNNAKNFLNRQSTQDHLPSLHGTSYNLIKKRYGIKLDLGYDFNDNIALFATLGQAVNYYKNNSSNFRLFSYTGNAPWIIEKPTLASNPFATSTGKKYALFYGGGFRLKIRENWYFVGEYNRSKISSINFNPNLTPISPSYLDSEGNLFDKTNDDRLPYGVSNYTKFKTILEVYKAGLSYNF